MKVILRLVFISSITIFVIGVLLKIMHWPYSQNMLLIGILISLFIYVPLLAILKLKRNQTRLLRIYYLSGLLSIIFILMSKLLQLINYNIDSASILGYLGLLALIIVLPLSFVLYKRTLLKKEKIKYRNSILMVVLYLSVVFSISYISNLKDKKQDKEFREFIKNQPEYSDIDW